MIQANYTLRLKDIPLIRFNLIIDTQNIAGHAIKNYSLNITFKTQHEFLLPIPLQFNINNATLLDWIRHRKAPRNRQFVNKILQAIDDDDNPMRYVAVSHALSLNDAYWITGDSLDEKWAEFNLYHHKFNELLANIAFTGYGSSIREPLASPELTSKGALKKCWTNRKDGIFLLKGDDFIKRADGRSQASIEYYAAQIAEVMGFEYVPYDLELFHHQNGEREIICTCKLFTSENVGHIDAYWVLKKKGFNLDKEDLSSARVQLQMAEIFGFEAYADLMIFDSLILNQDRHLGNFGYLIDNNTGELLRPAPIFDNGFSMFYGAADSDLHNIEAYINSLQGKYINFKKQTSLFLERRYLKGIRSLLDFKFHRHPKYNIAESTVNYPRLKSRAWRI